MNILHSSSLSIDNLHTCPGMIGMIDVQIIKISMYADIYTHIFKYLKEYFIRIKSPIIIQFVVVLLDITCDLPKR